MKRASLVRFCTLLFLATSLLGQGINPQIHEKPHDYCSRLLQPNELKKQVLIKPKAHLQKQETRMMKSASYSFSYLNSLSYSDLVDLVVTLDWSDIDGLFYYSADAVTFYSNNARMQALFDAVEQRGASFTSSDEKGLLTLVNVIRAGFYIAWGDDVLGFMHEDPYKQKTWAGMQSMSQNPNMKVGTADQNSAMEALGRYAGIGTCPPSVPNNLAPALNEFMANAGTYLFDSKKTGALYYIINGIGYAIGDFGLGQNPSSTAYYNALNTYLSSLKPLAMYGSINESYTWLINNAVTTYGSLGRSSSNQNEIVQTLTDVISTYGKWQFPSVWSAKTLINHYNGTDATGYTYTEESLGAEIEAVVLPKYKEYDNGTVKVKYGGNVSDEKIDRLYWASKEVRNQFYRVVGNSNPLEQGNPDDILTMVIYNSPSEYEFNSVINNLSTNNGGLYIESYGTFYTYERTPAQSIYSLEELFRHEFTHYLQGRYMVPGMWGDPGIYDNGRMNWIEEGQAEFMAGASRGNNIRPRRSIAERIASDSPSTHFTPSQLFNSTYNDGWEFYRYGFVFWHYLYESRKDVIFDLMAFVKSGNGNGVDNFLANLAQQNSVKTGFQAKIDEIAANASSYPDPMASDVYLTNITETSLTNIQSHINSFAGLNHLINEEIPSPAHKMFKISGSLTQSKSANRTADWNVTNNHVNAVLTSINDGSWAGYETVNAAFSDYRVQGKNVTYNVTFEGKLSGTGGTTNQSPIARANGPYTAETGETISFSSAGSSDPDGQITAYNWNFGDGTFSTDANPSHHYSTAGTYTVFLTVTDNGGLSASASTTATITDAGTGGDYITLETEPNDRFSEANGPVGSNINVAGNLEPSSSSDRFYFTLNRLEDISITVDILSGSTKVNWLLYHESDTGTYLAWAQTNGSKREGSYTPTQTGTYFISVYTWGSNSSGYTLNVQSEGIGQGNENYITSETENNNSSANANGPIGNTVNVTGIITTTSDFEWFYFDLTQNGTIAIDVDIPAGGATWLLYHESDLSTYVAYPTSSNGSHKLGNYSGQSGRYYLMMYAYQGSNIDYSISVNSAAMGVSGPMAPQEFSMATYPNPFNPVTNIRFALPERMAVQVAIFNAIGQRVKTLVNGNVLDAAYHTFKWNGTNGQNQKLSSGIYFLKISTAKFSNTQKLILLK